MFAVSVNFLKNQIAILFLSAITLWVFKYLTAFYSFFFACKRTHARPKDEWRNLSVLNLFSSVLNAVEIMASENFQRAIYFNNKIVSQ